MSVVQFNKLAHVDGLILKARKGLEMVSSGERLALQGWVEYGSALNELRAEWVSDALFGEKVAEHGLNVMKLTMLDGTVKEREVRRDVRSAAMWAAANPDEFDKARLIKPGCESIYALHRNFLHQIQSREEAERRKYDRDRFDAEMHNIMVDESRVLEPSVDVRHLLDKYKKTMALATNNANPHEAAVAKAKAMEIKTKLTEVYEVPEAEIERKPVADEDNWLKNPILLRFWELYNILERCQGLEMYTNKWPEFQDDLLAQLEKMAATLREIKSERST
jgi:hypothetical protein